MRHRYSIGLAVAALGITSLVLADPPSIGPPTSREIAHGVWLIPGATIPNREPDGNTLIVDAPEGLIVVDTGRHHSVQCTVRRLRCSTTVSASIVEKCGNESSTSDSLFAAGASASPFTQSPPLGRVIPGAS